MLITGATQKTTELFQQQAACICN